MSPATIALITALVQLAMQFAPELIKECQLAIGLIGNTTDPTPAQQADIDAALDATYQKLQTIVAARAAEAAADATPLASSQSDTAVTTGVADAAT